MMRHSRLVTAVVALALPIAIASQAQQQTAAPETVLWTSISPGDPVQIVRVLYNGHPIESRVPFQGNTEWIKGLSVQVRNVSNKTLTFVSLQVVFRVSGKVVVQFAKLGQLPEHRRLSQDGSGTIDPDPSQPISIAPGQGIIVPFGPAFPHIREAILQKLSPQLSLGDVHYCDIVPGQAFFSDGTMWQIGQFFKETHENKNTYDRSTPEEFYGKDRGTSH